MSVNAFCIAVNPDTENHIYIKSSIWWFTPFAAHAHSPASLLLRMASNSRCISREVLCSGKCRREGLFRCHEA
jgi:hypothetical protein